MQTGLGKPISTHLPLRKKIIFRFRPLRFIFNVSMAHTKKNRKKKTTANPKLLTGRIEITKKGMAFVTVEGLERDVIIKHGYVGTALDGDEVKIEITNTTAKRGGRMEGAVREVVRRKQTEFTGKLEVHPHFAFLIPDKPNMPVDIFVPLHLLNGAKNGDHT